MNHSVYSAILIALRRSVIQFRTNFLRTALTLLGVVMGVGAVVAMMSIGEGAQREIVAQIESMGAKSVHIIAKPVAKSELSNLVNSSTGLSERDARAILESVVGVESVGYRSKHTPSTTSLIRSAHETTVYGISKSFLQAQNLKVVMGRDFYTLDHRNGMRFAVIGEALAKQEFKNDPIGKSIRVENSFFEIIGVLEKQGDAKGASATDYATSILIPITSFFEELKPKPAYGVLDMISVQVQSTEKTLLAKSIVSTLLSRNHGGVKDFEIISPEEVLRQKKKTQSLFNAVLIAIAAISLIVGGIGVMNIMLANVMERISEIGLRRAVGARRRDIRNQFLAESILICFTGGLIGVLLGYGGSFLASQFADLPMAFAWEATLLAFLISLVVGVSFGLMPAMKAAEISPIEALRSK